MSIDGILNVNKPAGITSFSVVAWLKRLTREKHVGHTGTLDPIATGVLPICLGQATRISYFLTNSNKTYLAQIELGITTDTFDREGRIIETKDASGVTGEMVRNALNDFQGIIEQIPPMYSALKYHGKRYYELARQGVKIEPKPRKIQIFNVEIVSYQLPVVIVKVECSKGTYIRSLADDLGHNLGCGAFLKNLTRIQSGPFHIEDAVSMDTIEDAFKRGLLPEILHPLDTPVLHLAAIIVNKNNESAICHGRSISVCDNPCIVSKEYCRAYTAEGDFLALLSYNSTENLWHPDKIFNIRDTRAD